MHDRPIPSGWEPEIIYMLRSLLLGGLLNSERYNVSVLEDTSLFLFGLISTEEEI